MRILLVIAVMVGFTAVGALLRRLGLVKASAAATLNRLALDVTLPAGIFLSLHHFALQRALLAGPLLVALLTFVLWGLGVVVARLLALRDGERAVFLLAVIFGNTAFIGFPVITAVFGTPGLAQAVLIDQVGAEPFAFTLGAVLAAKGAERAAAIPWKRELVQLARFPPLVALAAGLLWNLGGLPPVPGWAAWGLGWLSKATVPLVMISLGLVVRAGSLRASWRLALVAALLRLVVAPALALAGCRLGGLPPLAVQVTTLEMAMPTMMFTLVLALRAGLDVELTAACIAATLAGSVVSLPVWLWIVGGA